MTMPKISVTGLTGFLLVGAMGLAGSTALADGSNKSSPFQITRGSFQAGPLIGLELVEVPRDKLLTMQQVSINATTLAEDVVDLTCWLEAWQATQSKRLASNLSAEMLPKADIVRKKILCIVSLFFLKGSVDQEANNNKMTMTKTS